MCRIVYAPNPGLLEAKDFADLFSHLEGTMGGDGNGLAIINGNKPMLVKGVRMDVGILARIAASASNPVLFHTRRATTGAVCNTLCQPFVDNGTALVHNGIWRDWQSPAMELILQGDLDANGPINDSLAAAALVAKYGRYTLEAINSGVFVVMTTEGAWLHLRQGVFKYCEDLDVYASDFPKDWPTPRSFGNDAIAFLGEDGPIFECGGWWSERSFLYKGAGHPVVVHPYYEDDDGFLAKERLVHPEEMTT